MLKRLFQTKTQTIASAAIIVASFSVLSRVFGFIRDRILAGSFGASDTLDVYFAAFRIPDFLFQLVIVGALSASFVPLFTKYYAHSEERAWELTNKLLNLIALFFGICTLVALVASPWLAPLIGLGYSPEKQLAIAHMTRVMFLGQFFLAVSMVYGSVLQGAKRFFVYSAAPVLYNIGIICGAVFLVPLMGELGLAWGVVLGSALHFALQTIGVYALGYRYAPIFVLRDPDVVYTFKHMLPRVMGLAVNQLNFLGMTMLATLLATGSLTLLQFAYNLNFFSIGVIAVSYAVAAFPTFCELAQKNDLPGFTKSFSQAARQILFFIVPATVLFIALRAQIVRVVLGAGQFDWPSTIVTADTLGLFACSFFAQALVFLLVRAYFAFEDTKTPFVVGFLAALMNMVLAYFAMKEFGVLGFGLAYSISALFQMILLWIPLRRRVGTLHEWRMVRSGSVFLVSGAACAVLTQASKFAVVHLVTLDTFFAVLLQGLVSGTIGLVAYFAVAYALKSEEMMTFVRGMHRRIFRKVQVHEEIVSEMG